jgi:single stranded DNA-binding protein
MFSRVILLGRLTKDIEFKEVGDTHLGRMRLAVNKRKKNQKGEWEDETVFISVGFFTRNPDYYQNKLKKGALAFVEGELRQFKSEDGSTVTEINGRRIIPLTLIKDGEEIEDASLDDIKDIEF